MKLMLGNEAIARGAYEAGVKLVAAYPGTPSTEVTETVAKYDEVYAEWAPNEKVAFEVAVGASYAGARAMVCMKHVGVNVAADPMFTAAYTGVNGGLVILVADDPGMHSSQNEQDSRYYAISAHIPMLEPSDSAEAKAFTALAFDISEKYDTPVFLRTTTRLAHSQSFVEEAQRREVAVKPYSKDITKYTMMPSSAIGRHVKVEERENRLKNDVESFDINRVEKGNDSLGIVCSGVVYQYVKEAIPNASVFKLGMVYPLPVESIKKFAKSVKRLVVVEELEPVIENTLKANGIECEGKNLFSVQGELSVATIKEKLLGDKNENVSFDLPVRPPVLCAGCPHRGVFYVLKKLGLTVSADIGCYTLGAGAPLSAVDTVLCMGASIGIAHGFKKALGEEAAKKVVSVIGDSTFIHSGITGLIDAVYNQSNLTLIILDNSTTGMTGHQDHPATGKTLKGEPAPILNLVDVCRSCGAKSINVVDAYNLKAVEDAVKAAVDEQAVSVVICQRPCALLNRNYPSPLYVEGCKKCGACLKIGCPAIEKQKEGNVIINPTQCVGCAVCSQLCKFGAIKGGKK